MDVSGRKKERGNDDFWSEHKENGDPRTEIGKAGLVADLIFAVGDLTCHLRPSPWTMLQVGCTLCSLSQEF